MRVFSSVIRKYNKTDEIAAKISQDDTWPLCVNQTERRWYYLQGRATSVVSWTKGPTPKTGELGGDQKREEGRERERKWTRGNEKLVDGKLRNVKGGEGERRREVEKRKETEIGEKECRILSK